MDKVYSQVILRLSVQTSSLLSNNPIKMSSHSSKPVSVDTIISYIKQLSYDDFVVVSKAVTAEKTVKAQERKELKEAKKAEKEAEKKEPKEKKPVPKHLRKSQAWVTFTLKNAIENGWDEFIITQRKKNKDTGITEEEEIIMPKSVDSGPGGAWIYEGSISDKNPDGKQINYKEAMSLSKALKLENDASWKQFEEQYVDDTEDSASDSDTASHTSKKSTVVRKTAAEKEAEAEAKKKAKEEEKEAKKMAKEAEKEAKKKAKEEEKASKDKPVKKAKEEEKVEKKEKVEKEKTEKKETEKEAKEVKKTVSKKTVK